MDGIRVKNHRVGSVFSHSFQYIKRVPEYRGELSVSGHSNWRGDENNNNNNSIELRMLDHSVSMARLARSSADRQVVATR